jgi:hypothetical protein
MKEGWKEFAVYSDAASAEILAGLLRSEGIPVEIAGDEPIPGLAGGFRVLVPTELVHRVRSIVSNAAFTDEELESFATGETDSDGDGPK